MNALIPLVADGRYYIDLSPIINFYYSIPYVFRCLFWLYCLVHVFFNLYHLLTRINNNVSKKSDM